MTDQAREAAPDVPETEAPAPPPRKTFNSYVLEQRNGAMHAELSEEMAALVKSVQDHGKGGTLTVTINVKPGAKGTRMVIVTDDIKVKAPRGERPATMFYVDGDGNLSRNDPTQPELPLRRVDVAPPADLRRAGGDS